MEGPSVESRVLDDLYANCKLTVNFSYATLTVIAEARLCDSSQVSIPCKVAACDFEKKVR